MRKLHGGQEVMTCGVAQRERRSVIKNTKLMYCLRLTQRKALGTNKCFAAYEQSLTHVLPAFYAHSMPSYCQRRQLAPSQMKESVVTVKARLTTEQAERTSTRVKYWARREAWCNA